MRKLPLLTLAALLAGTAFSLLAAPPSETRDDKTVDSRFEELLAMPADARRAELKKMDPEERRGLWFRLKKAQEAQRTTDKGADLGTRGSDSAQPVGGKARTTPMPVSALGTIQYDDGSGATIFGEINSPSNILRGNRYDTHGGGNPVTASGSVDTVVAVVRPGTIASQSSAGFVLYNQQNTATGGAMAAFSTFAGAGTGATETVTFAGMSANYTGNSFLILFGNFDESYLPVFGTGTTQAQGHHAVLGATGGTGPNITSVSAMSGLNGLIRATGNVLPVELMSFDVD